ncbi:MAG TPA: hypothetical protein VFR37_04290 [Longimicrobium sp.]|nr:hypothetical protein [Longimicrobium sp.]
MRKDLSVCLLGLMIVTCVHPVHGQGIGLPVSPSARSTVLRDLPVRLERADTLEVRLPPDAAAAVAADLADAPATLQIDNQAYTVIGVQGDRATVTRTFVEEGRALVLASQASCALSDTTKFLAWPVHTRAHAECFWTQPGITTLNYATLSGTGESRSVTVDLVSDLIGPVRAYVIGSVAAAEPEEEGDETETQGGGILQEETESEVDENVQRFLSSGGNAVLGFMFPGPTFRSAVTNSVRAPDFMGYLLFAPRIGFDVPQANSSASNAKVNLDVGPELTFAAHGDQLALYTQLRYAVVAGSPEFYQGLSLEGNDPFSYGRLNVGLRLRVLGQTNVLLSWSKPFSGPDQLVKSGSQLHFTVQKDAPAPQNEE